MKRKKVDAPPTRIYTYGLPCGPVENSDLVDDQIRLAHRYNNDLIAIERARRQAVRAILGEVADVAAVQARLEPVENEAEELRTQLKKARAQKRKRVAADKATLDRLAELRVERRSLREELKAAKALLRNDPTVQERISVCNDRAADMVRRYREVNGLYWGTYLLVEKAMEEARKGKMDPQFRRHWDGRGRIGVQIQKGMTVACATSGTDTRLRLDLTPRRRVSKRHPEGIEVPHSGTAWLRVCSNEKGGPIWAVFPMIYHRPLPEDAMIKYVWAQRKRIGTRWRWELQLSIEARSFVVLPKPGHTVAVDFGAKGNEGGYRVAFALGTDGVSESLPVPRDVTSALEHADSLHSIRDRNFNAVREQLMSWWASTASVPEWLRDTLCHLAHWRAIVKLVRVAHRWRGERFDGDADGYALMEAWAKQDRHLYQWEANERSRALGRRREVCRIWAAGLRSRYATLVTENIDFAKLARNVKPEEDASADHLHRTRTLAAPSEVRTVVREAFSGREERLEPAARDASCLLCGAPTVQGGYVVACTACGARLDGDYARCWALLRDTEHDLTEVLHAWNRSTKFVEDVNRRASHER